MLTLRRQDLEAICAQARAEHPAECCGILTAPGPSAAADAAASVVHPCRNIQDELHRRDPGQYPRDARTAYFIDPQELFRIVSGAEREGGRVTGFYHSHVDCEAYFSAEDVERAMAWGEPAYPDAVYLVVSVYGDGVRGHRAFAWSEGERVYREAQVAVIDP